METISGTVARVNGKGFQIAEREGWLNVSKYANPAPTMPTVGARVSITLDKSGYVRKIEPAAEPTTSAPTAEPTATTTARGLIDRETAITRMATLNTATAILSAGGQTVEVDDVLAVAERLETWVNRN